MHSEAAAIIMTTTTFPAIIAPTATASPPNLLLSGIGIKMVPGTGTSTTWTMATKNKFTIYMTRDHLLRAMYTIGMI